MVGSLLSAAMMVVLDELLTRASWPGVIDSLYTRHVMPAFFSDVNMLRAFLMLWTAPFVHALWPVGMPSVGASRVSPAGMHHHAESSVTPKSSPEPSAI